MFMSNPVSFTHDITDRAKLGFQDQSSQEFAFLAECGYQKLNSSITLTEYSNGFVGVNIYHGRRSYEIGFEIARNDRIYSIAEIIQIENYDAGEGYRNYVATTDVGVNEGLGNLSRLVKLYAAKPLQGHEAVFSKLDVQRKKWGERLELQTKITSIKPRADYAFRQAQYANAANLYDQIRSGLTPAELKKADMARARAAPEK